MLTESKRHSFSQWPNPEIPPVAAGVYAIWEGDILLDCGMSGRKIEENRHKKRFGLITRLASHASGRQFCVYVANRLVIPQLKPSDLPRYASGKVRLDDLTRRYITERL